jgi:hypothetical protein
MLGIKVSITSRPVVNELRLSQLLQHQLVITMEVINATRSRMFRVLAQTLRPHHAKMRLPTKRLFSSKSRITLETPESFLTKVISRHIEDTGSSIRTYKFISIFTYKPHRTYPRHISSSKGRHETNPIQAPLSHISNSDKQSTGLHRIQGSSNIKTNFGEEDSGRPACFEGRLRKGVRIRQEDLLRQTPCWSCGNEGTS